MITKDKSFLAMSLGIVISSQGLASISHADSINYNKVILSNPYAIGCGTVIEPSLNVRSTPSTSGTSVGTLSYNEKVEILSKNNGWYKISFNGKQGYINSSYLKLEPIEKGIDVSKWNGNIDWNKVKNSGIDYVIIRAGYGASNVDPNFKSYIEGASKAGLKIGVYWFSYATNPQNAIIEAKKCLETVSPYKNSITYPIFFDYEYDSVTYANSNGISITKDLATEMASAFINTVKSSGYKTGIYTNKDFSSNYFSKNLIDSTNLWIARYNSTNNFNGSYSMLQYSEKGTVPGINGYVDLNYTYFKTSRSNSSTYSTSYTKTTSSVNTISNSTTGVTTVNLNLRKDMSASSSVVSTIPANATVDILEKSQYGWYKVKYKHFVGYVVGNYINI